VNFRGSLGFGETATAVLPGKAGTLDIEDVYVAAQAALTQYSTVLDSARVGIMGGSHGGFIASHSLGQYPAFYKTAVLRNPVTNIASMLSTTDIPDWCITEACGLEAMTGWNGMMPIPSADLLARLLAASPIAHVSKVVAPVLFTLGMKDKRVPASQGIEFNYALRARGIPTRVLAYPEDVHALDRVATEGDAWTNIILWLATHLNLPLPA
jgi:acylaminoacyl-peptidase